MRCAVTRDEYGNILDVVSQNGNQSKLYFDLLFQLNDPELALKEYALTFTKSFNDSMGSAVRDNNGEHTIDTYNRYNQGGVEVNKTQYQLLENRKQEEFISSEKTIRDLAARMSDRIGIPVKFESDRTKKYKGKLETKPGFDNNTKQFDNITYAVVNLAYATLDTPIHEILGHPIIRAIKNKNRIEQNEYSIKSFTYKGDIYKTEKDIFGYSYKNDEIIDDKEFDKIAKEYLEEGLSQSTQLYQNLLKELETGKGKEVLDRIKRDYIFKDFNDIKYVSDDTFIVPDAGDTDRGRYYLTNENADNLGNYTIEEISKMYPTFGETEYTSEEQQEEAIVELLGLMTAEKLDAVKDGKLISLLKRLLKEIKAFVRDLLKQREVEVDKLPDNMTLGDIADLLAYSNSKLILPGNEVVYTTPDNQQFKTYAEASKHISDLARSVEDVDLSDISLERKLSQEDLQKIQELEKQKQEKENYFNSKKYQQDKGFELYKLNKKLEELKNKKVNFYSQEPSLDLEDKEKYGFQDFDYIRVESTYGRGNEYHKDILGENYEGYYIHGYNTSTGKPKKKILPITKEQAIEIWQKDKSSKYEVGDRQEIFRTEDSIRYLQEDSEIKYEISSIEQEIKNIKAGQNTIQNFIEKNKQYEQSKEIIEEWKRINDIQYNPEEIYSRGQEFSSVVGAYSSFDVNLMMQNLLSHIEDNEKAGGKFAISAFTKPVDKQIGHLEGGGGKIKFKIYPQSKDILWAANTDVYSGSVWDASEKVNKDKKSELLGVSYTKYPSLNYINTVQPNLADIVDKLNHHHNELGIVLTGNNFRLEYDEDIPYTTKKIIDSINSILDQKYGKLVKPEIKQVYERNNIVKTDILIKNYNEQTTLDKSFKNIDEAEKYAVDKWGIDLINSGKIIIKSYYGKQPTQTNETLKESIESVKNKLKVFEDYYILDKDGDNWIILGENNEFVGSWTNKEDAEKELNKLQPKNKEKEYTSQALINTKIAALKEVAKKYSRILIRSEVRPISLRETYGFNDFDDLPFQKIPTTLDIPTELGFRDLTTDEYYQLDEDNLANQYASQLENATVEQKKTFDAISKMHNSVYKEVVGDDVNTGKPMYAYTMKDALGNDVTLKSVTTTLNENPRYSFDGTNTEDTFINWGNTADMILSGIVEGKTIEQIEKQLSAEFPLIDVNEIMTQEAREQLYKLFTEYVNEQKSKGNVILTQIRHGNLNKKIGGTADIIIVLPDGRVQYADLKTSYKPFVGTDSTFKREFKKSPISIKASKFERYSAQLSTYAAIGTHNGLTVDITNPINILPIYLKTEDKTAIDTELQTEESNTYYIKGKYMQNIVTEYSSRYTSNTFKDIFSKMLSALYRAKDTFTKAGDIDKANEIGQLIKDLDNTEFYSGITNMVNNAYELFVGRKDSLYKVLNSLLSTEVTADNVSEVLNTINEIESLIDLYHPANENSALQQLSAQLRKNNITIEDESFASKLREVIGTIADMREGIKDKLPSMLAEYLVTAIPANANDNIIKQYEAKLKKLKVISGREGDRNKRKTKELEKEIEDFQLQYNITDNNGKLQPDLKAMLEREIKDGGYKDITTLDRYISSAVQMPVGFLATFAIKLKTALEEARQLAIDFQYKANDAFNEFMKDRSFQQPEKLYEGIYYNKEVYGRDEATGKYVKKNNVLGLVSFIDYNAFNQAKAKMYEEASLIEDNGDRSVFIANWYRDNTQQRPDEDIKANGVTLVESINTVYKRKRLKLGSDSDRFKAWEALNTFIDKDGTKRYVGELQIPNLSKYKSKDFEKLSQDKSKFKLYTFALQTYFESQSLQPARSTFDYEEYKYIAPYIMKSSMDRLTDNGFKSLINNKIDDVYKRLDDDMNEHGYDPNTKSIHVLYYNSANPVKYDDASKDLMNTILRYKIAADRYAKRKEVGVIGDALLSRVRNTNPLQVDDAGNSISEKLNNRITGFLDKKLKSKGNNAADLLEAFIEAQIYGITRKDSKLNGIDLNKLTDNFMSFAAFTQLGLDVTLAVSNSLTANITTAIDAAGKRVYGVGAWAKASGKYWTYEKDFISDAMNPVKKSLIGQLVDIYDPMQGDFVDNYGRKIGKGVVKAKWNSSQAFTGMRKGEHRAQVTAMIAALSETKVKYTNPTTGEVSMIRLIDAYEIPAGQTRIQLKEGVELSKQVGLVDINVQNTLHSVNTSLHGIYNSFEAPDISRHWLGRLLQMYRKYLPAGLKYRYKREGFNYQLGDFTEGTYASFYGTLVSDWRELVRALQGKETYLSDVEVANLRRALAEQAVVLSTGLLVIALQAALEGEDDDEKDAAKWLLYTALRLNQEIALYGAALNPLSYGIPSYRPLWKTFTNVSAITTLGDKVVRLMGSALGDSVNIITGEDIERYERDAGLFEKGDSKTLANFLKLLGINNRKLLQDPEDAVNLLILEKGAGG